MDYTIYKFGINELIIDDNMFSFESRSTKFVNLELDQSGKII